MNFKEIEELLRLYYEGNTTAEEERQLREYFLNEEVPPHLAVEADLFRGIAGNASEEIPDPDFEEKLFAKLEDKPVVHISVIRNRYYSILGIAAGVLLLAGLFFTFSNDFMMKQGNKQNRDALAAYVQTKEVLLMVSANLNNGLDKIAPISKFNEGMQNAAMISAFNKYQSIIINPDDFNRSPKH